MNSRALTSQVLLNGPDRAADWSVAGDRPGDMHRRCRCPVWYLRVQQQPSPASISRGDRKLSWFALPADLRIAVILGVGIGLAAAASPSVNAVVRPIVRVLGAAAQGRQRIPIASCCRPATPRRPRWSPRMYCSDLAFATHMGHHFAEQKLIWSAMAGNAAPPNPAQGGAGRRAVDPHWVPDRTCDFAHRRCFNDHLEPRWLSAIFWSRRRDFPTIDMFVLLITISLL